ncbi:hypothetical protein NDU88_004075 [Pleurodeles waltl]|uniref:Uncharacterized protein n=1 Tax=Pleurodeles waltl TaxID=8319 RepID=A0AAV7LKM5_PLEWA|nr:hypothetical protein NDU88_004075 [Pleurodeles waltl]
MRRRGLGAGALLWSAAVLGLKARPSERPEWTLGCGCPGDRMPDLPLEETRQQGFGTEVVLLARGEAAAGEDIWPSSWWAED